MDLRVAGLEDLEARLETAVDRLGALQAGTRVESASFFSEPFMRDHTQFDSFAAFCAESPWQVEEVGDLQDAPREQLDDYVAATTEFETWEGMKTQAAEEEIIDQVVA
jgi:hypothetical protein